MRRLARRRGHGRVTLLHTGPGRHGAGAPGPSSVAPIAIASGAAANGAISVIGQSSAQIAGGASTGIQASGVDLYVRDVNVSPSTEIGIVADTGATLRLSRVKVQNNGRGGIFVNGASYDIDDALVNANGPGDDMGAAWGGVRIKSPPTSGPARINRLSVTANNQVGLSCTAAVTATGVLASGNVGGIDISPTCGVTPCTTAGAMCGSDL